MSRTEPPQRPALRYFGGKWNLAPWIIKHFPPHVNYVEPFGGAASVLLQKSPCRQEVYNDLDEHIVDLFRVLRQPELANQLIDKLKLTPYSRVEFEKSYDLAEETDPVEKARKIITLSFLAYSTDGITRLRKTGFRAGPNRKRFQPACKDWKTFPESLYAIVERLKNVIIENRDALELLDIHDGPQTLFYLDPPYPHNTRWSKKRYRFELDNDQHIELLEKIKTLDGMVVITTYENDLYSDLLEAWQKKRRQTRAQAGNGKANKIATECLWLSPTVSELQRQKQLFQ